MTRMHLFVDCFIVSNELYLMKRTFSSFSEHIDILHIGLKKQLPHSAAVELLTHLVQAESFFCYYYMTFT